MKELSGRPWKKAPLSGHSSEQNDGSYKTCRITRDQILSGDHPLISSEQKSKVVDSSYFSVIRKRIEIISRRESSKPQPGYFSAWVRIRDYPKTNLHITLLDLSIITYLIPKLLIGALPNVHVVLR